MAIKADKLLNKSSGRLAMQKAQQEKMIGGGPSNIVLSKKSIKGIEGIKINVIKIENIFKGSLALDKKQLDDKKKATSKKRKEDIETKLETKPNAEGGKVKMPSAPRMGILDWIRNFIGNILLGYFAVRLIDHLPKIMPILKFLGNAVDFIIDIGGKLLNGLVTFIDIGYKAYDATRGLVKNLFGKSGEKQFDQLSSVLNTFLNTVIIAGMLFAGSGGFGGGPRGGPKGGGPRGGPSAPGTRGTRTTSGGRPQGRPDIRNPLRQTPKVTTGGGGAGGLDIRNPLRAKPKVTLSGGGNKALLSSVRPFLKRIPLPVIGALIDFGLSVALGENVGRAAFRAIGAGLLGAVGAAVGSVVPIAGNIIGGIIGGTAGDMAGGALYDMFFTGKKPQQKGKVQGKAGGGITRGGKSAGGVKRTISKGKYKRTIVKKAQKPLKTEFKDKEVKKSTEELDRTKYFGPILAISSKIMNKEEPTDGDYKNVGLGINMLIAKGIQDKQLKGGIVAKFAEGGLVDPDILSAAETGGDISSWVANVFRGEIETGAQKTMREMKERRAEKKTESGGGEDEYDDSDGGGGGSLTTGQWGPILDLIASKESGGSYTKMYGGKENPSLVNMTLQEVSAFQSAHAKKTGSAAMGRYQFMNALGQGDAVGLKPTDKFSPENQDKMAVGLIVNKRKVTLDMIKSNPDEAMIRLGMEWAAIGMPKSMRGHRRMVAAGETYYAGDGMNKAHITPAQMRAAFAKTVGGGYSQAELAKSQAGPVGQIGDERMTGGGPNAQKIIAGAKKIIGAKRGVGDRCADTTRQALAAGGLTALSKKRTQKGDLDTPKGTKYNGPDFAASFGGSDMGQVIRNRKNIKAGDIVLWRQYSAGGKYNVDAITHVGIAADDGLKNQYDHNRERGFQYRPHWDRSSGTEWFAGVRLMDKGGMINGLTPAILGEAGRPEGVVGGKITQLLEEMSPGTLPAIIGSRNKSDLRNTLENIIPVEDIIVIPSPSAPEEDDDYGSDGGGGVLIASGGGRPDPYSTLYQGG